MTRLRQLVAAALFGLAFVPPASSRGGAPPGVRRPNILLIVTDDQGYGELRLHGNPDIETPNLDRLAAEGLRMTHFYASPVCTPTRAALMTGRYAQRTGAIDTYLGRDTLAANETTLAQVLGRAGYRTGLIGKWHLGRYMRYHPNERGFDHFFGFWQYGFINRYFDSEELWENKQPITTAGYVTDVLTDQAIRFIQGEPARPFFLYLAYNAPHAPRLAPDAAVERCLRRGMPLADAQTYAMVERVDAGVGKLLARLDASGRRDNTLVLFMSDNGGTTRRYAAGLRDLKGTVYEGGIRVPLFARWPARWPSGRVIETPAQHIDLFPTLCQAAEILPAGTLPLDGKSLLPLWSGTGPQDPPHPFLYHQWTRVRPSAEQNWAIHDCRDPGALWKLANGALYNLTDDPGESRDQAAAQPARVALLRRTFLEWFRDVTAGQSYQRVPIEVGREDENPVEIDLTWGEPTGGPLRPEYRHYNRDVLTNWTKPGEAVEWRVDVLKSGRYQVEMVYGCEAADAGARIRLSLGQAALSATVRALGGVDGYIHRAVGDMRLKSGRGVLRLEAVAVPGSKVMELHKLILRRL